MKKLLYCCCCLLMAVSLTGCWNSKVVQEMIYITSIGLDYENGKYIIYGQLLNFSNVAKHEGTEVGSKIPVWVGRGEGPTITEAAANLYTTSQLRIFWGHVKAIVVTERMMKKGIHNLFDFFSRYREIRYNVWIYGTNENLVDILSQNSIMNLSPLLSVMLNPTDIFYQRSYIPPVYARRFISEFNDPGQTAVMPSISINKDAWKEAEKDVKLLRINGSYYFRDNKVVGWLSEEDLKGIRWAEEKMKRSPLVVVEKGKKAAVLILVRRSYRVEPIVEDGRVRYTMRVKAEAYIDELMKNIPERTIEANANKAVADEIMYTFKKGLSIKADVLQLDKTLYRKMNRKWHEVHKKSSFVLDKDSFKSIEVHVRLLHSGKYKERHK